MLLRLGIFVFLFLFFSGGALVNPVLGVLGYLAHYIIGPETEWWHAPIKSLGVRYSFTLAALTAVGMFLNSAKLRYGDILVRQEKLALWMLGLILVLTLLGPETVGRYVTTDHASVKITKIVVFCLMMTHVVTRMKDVNKVLWVIIVGALILGVQAYLLPRRAFIGGRLDAKIGGADFLDSNSLAAFMVAATVVTGTVFMRVRWLGKLLCAAAGAFSLNTIVLCRSRGAVLALLGAGMAIVVASPRHVRMKLLAGMGVVAVGLLFVADPQFLTRMGNISKHAGAVAQGNESSDRSTMMRIEAWRGGMKMVQDNPLGVGPGNFNQNIGRYAPSVTGLSPHSVYIQAAAELGFAGFFLFLAMLANGFLTVLQVNREAARLPPKERSEIQWTASASGAVLIGYATCGITGHILYLECFWWFLLLPVCLQRACDNALEELSPVREAALPASMGRVAGP